MNSPLAEESPLGVGRARGLLTSADRSVVNAGFALPRVPAPTGRTGRRSALPCLRAIRRAGAGRDFPALRAAVPV